MSISKIKTSDIIEVRQVVSYNHYTIWRDIMEGFICMYKRINLILLIVIYLTLSGLAFGQNGVYLNRDICSDGFIDIIVPNLIVEEVVV